jgi:cell wall-associated NlpC family hydrolase
MKKIWSLLCLSSVVHSFAVSQKALVIVPIADLVGQPFTNKKQPEPAYSYQNLPICGGKNHGQSCVRMHQLLFNETVDIVQEQSDEVLVSIPNAFFTTEANRHTTTYWTHKKNLIPLDTLEQKGLNLDYIPPAISYETTNANQPNIITLHMPFHDVHNNRTFSAGTRFVCMHTTTSEENYTTHYFDNKTSTYTPLEIPKNRCLPIKNFSKKERIALFVQVVRNWATLETGCIPYVWGGCSFNNKSTSHTFAENSLNNNSATFYTVDHYTATPKSGFDCSGMVLRATQLCGIPYFFKNTSTIAQNLAPLKNDEALHDGDIILFSGHVMVVGSTKNNTLFEARHYNHGYGKVQEIELARVFKGIETYTDLVNAYNTRKPLQRIDKNGAVRDTIPTFKLLRMESVWPQATT